MTKTGTAIRSLMLTRELKLGVVPPHSEPAQSSMRSAPELLAIKADSELKQAISRRTMAAEKWTTGGEPSVSIAEVDHARKPENEYRPDSSSAAVNEYIRTTEDARGRLPQNGVWKE